MNHLFLNRVLVLVTSAFLCLSSARAETPPSQEMIATWWKAKSKEEVPTLGELIEVRLRSKEVAYLIEVAFNRGRNDMFRTVMVRPRLREVREVDEPVATDIKVYDLDRNGVSEVVAKMISSGGGTYKGVHVVVQFDEWSPVVLYESEVERTCEPTDSSPGCSSRDISWKFVDINGDGTIDLLETVTMQETPPKGRTITKKETHKLLFRKHDMFVE